MKISPKSLIYAVLLLTTTTFSTNTVQNGLKQVPKNPGFFLNYTVNVEKKIALNTSTDPKNTSIVTVDFYEYFNQFNGGLSLVNPNENTKIVTEPVQTILPKIDSNTLFLSFGRVRTDVLRNNSALNFTWTLTKPKTGAQSTSLNLFNGADLTKINRKIPLTGELQATQSISLYGKDLKNMFLVGLLANQSGWFSYGSLDPSTTNWALKTQILVYNAPNPPVSDPSKPQTQRPVQGTAIKFSKVQAANYVSNSTSGIQRLTVLGLTTENVLLAIKISPNSPDFSYTVIATNISNFDFDIAKTKSTTHGDILVIQAINTVKFPAFIPVWQDNFTRFAAGDHDISKAIINPPYDYSKLKCRTFNAGNRDPEDYRFEVLTFDNKFKVVYTLQTEFEVKFKHAAPLFDGTWDMDASSYNLPSNTEINTCEMSNDFIVCIGTSKLGGASSTKGSGQQTTILAVWTRYKSTVYRGGQFSYRVQNIGLTEMLEGSLLVSDYQGNVFTYIDGQGSPQVFNSLKLEKMVKLQFDFGGKAGNVNQNLQLYENYWGDRSKSVQVTAEEYLFSIKAFRLSYDILLYSVIGAMVIMLLCTIVILRTAERSNKAETSQGEYAEMLVEQNISLSETGFGDDGKL